MNYNNNTNLEEPLIIKYINNTIASSENNSNNKNKKIKRKKSKELRNMATGVNSTYHDISSSKMLG
jgi:hypothetical protein